MVGARAGLGLVLLGLAAPALANQPPRPSPSEIREQLRARAKGFLEECAEQARREGRFGDVFVGLDRRGRFRVSTTPGLGGRHERCARRALARAEVFWRGDLLRDGMDLWLGTPVPLLPEPPAVMPLWLALHQAPAGQRAPAAAALRRVLPPDVTVTAAGCLAVTGEAVNQGFELWLDRFARTVSYHWRNLLPPPVPELRVLGPTLIATLHSETTTRCLLPLDEPTTRALRARMDEQGSCWAGDTVDLLLHREVRFPDDRRYRAVSVAVQRACAIDTAGALVCCGVPLADLPAGPFTAVSMTDGQGCAVTTAGTLACWGTGPHLAHPTGPLTDVAVGSGRGCALGRDGAVTCWGNVPETAFAGGRFRKIAVSDDGACALDGAGALTCVKQGAPVVHKGPFLEISARHPCVLRADHTVWCSDWTDTGRWGLAARAHFTDFVLALRHGCGRQADGTVECFGQAPRTAFNPPPGKFVSLSAGYDRICGVRDDGRIACWGNPASFNFR